MHLSLLHFILLFAFTTTIAVALPATAPATEDLELPALPDMPDSTFTYMSVYQHPQLPSTACIMACISAMRELALLDLNADISDSSTWTHPQYPQVVISLQRETPRKMTVRWAMFLILAGMRDMMTRRLYETSVFLGRYRNINIGQVKYGFNTHSSPQQAHISTNRSARNDAAKDPTDHELLILENSPLSSDQLHGNIEYLDKVMDKRDSFMMLIWLLMSLASKNNDIFAAIHCSVRGMTVEVRSIWNAVPHPERHPLNSGDMVNMIAHLAEVLERENKF